MNTVDAGKPAPGSGLRERAITAMVLAPVGIAAVLMLPHAWFAAFMAILFLIGAWEWALLSGSQSALTRITIVFLHAIVLGSLWIAGETAWPQVIWAGVGFWLLAPFWLHNYTFGAQDRRRSLLMKTCAGLLAIVPAWVAALLLEYGERGPQWVLFVLVLVWCADTCAYFAGRRFGTTKLAPNISPGKTRAGAYGAVAGCTVYAATVGHFVFSIKLDALLPFIGLCIVTVVFSIVGDLLESLIKRHSHVKDSGSLFPGHGGMLDRFDSLFAALPIFVAGHVLLGI